MSDTCVSENENDNSESSNINDQAANEQLIQNCLWNSHSQAEKRDLLSDNLSVYGCLVNNSRSEIMSGANSIDCDRCKSKQLASRQCVLKQLPEVSVIHLKRYRQVISGKSARLVKDS